ncbi:MAG: VPLPA-CTERM sorting domain-containing protein [Nitrospira sp.]|nr:VPLPA-CTERM sorting domain-containing protein [Nitrospira sp.]
MRNRTSIRQVLGSVVAMGAIGFAIGVPSPASALEFGYGDLAFIMWGGNNERYEHFGIDSATRLEGTEVFGSVVSDSELELLREGATLGVRWGLYGTTPDGSHLYVTTQAREITEHIRNNVFGTPQATERFLFWGSSHIPYVTGTRQSGDPDNRLADNPFILPAANRHSWTSDLGRDRAPNLGGNLPFRSDGGLNQTLRIFKIAADGSDFPDIQIVGVAELREGSAHLIITPNNARSPEPIPVPAAAVLFGSGLIGLAGMARRAMTR